MNIRNDLKNLNRTINDIDYAFTVCLKETIEPLLLLKEVKREEDKVTIELTNQEYLDLQEAIYDMMRIGKLFE